MSLVASLATYSLKGSVRVYGPGDDTAQQAPHDMRIRRARVYPRFLLAGTIGLGESYMDGDWDCDDLAEFFCRAVRARADKGSGGLLRPLIGLQQRLRNPHSLARAREVNEQHYDLGNDLYEAMLGPSMVYTCGYQGRGARTLEDMQRDKLQIVCEKIGLKPGDRVLDIGCGFGAFAKFATERFGASVVGVSLSKEQLAYGRAWCSGLPVELVELDYRNVPDCYQPESFDHVVSIGMFEAVRPENFRTFMDVVARMLKPGGLCLLHTIGMEEPGFDPWIEKYIFPNGYLPSVTQIRVAIVGLLKELDLHSFGPDYDPTLMAWHRNFKDAWPALMASGKYDERFRRMWEYYLLQCAGLARARQTRLWQFVLAKGSVPNYTRVR